MAGTNKWRIVDEAAWIFSWRNTCNPDNHIIAFTCFLTHPYYRKKDLRGLILMTKTCIEVDNGNMDPKKAAKQ